MPQKRNPYALAAIRAQAGQAAGDVTAALTVAHTGSARTDHFHLLNGLVPRALEEAGAIARLAAAVLAGLSVNADRMGQVAREGFTNSADVADVLAATGGMDYRTAHKVVGLAVRRLIEQGAGELTAEAVADAALELTGATVAVDPAQLDPAACAQARLQAGSSSQAAMGAMLDEVDAQGAADRHWAAEALAAAAEAEGVLLARATALARA
jgi:argininosuccinate lyase